MAIPTFMNFPRLSNAQIRKTKWLKPYTPVSIVLEQVVLNKKILTAVRR